MRLYTIQSLDVVHLLYRDQIYFPTFEKASWLQDDMSESFGHCFMWMTDQYNKRKNHDFSSAPVWWYTDFNDAVRHLKKSSTNQVFLQAEVPDKVVLLHDANLWEWGPFSNLHLGWLGHSMELTDNWEGTKFPELFDKIWDAYKHNADAMVQTWESIFNISKSNPPERIHATTQYIDLFWIEKKKGHEAQPSEM